MKINWVWFWVWANVMLLLIAAVVLVYIMVTPRRARAATITHTATSITLRGEILPGDDTAFAAAILPTTRSVTLTSPGGRLDEAYRLAAIIRWHSLRVRIDGYCQSSCILLLAAAAKRVIPAGTNICVHRVYIQDGMGSDADPETQAFASQLATYGVPRVIVDKMTNTYQPACAVLSSHELAQLR